MTWPLPRQKGVDLGWTLGSRKVYLILIYNCERLFIIVVERFENLFRQEG
jgi:hypothetical protein